MLAASGWHVIFGMPQIAIIMGCLIPIVAVISTYWAKARKAESDNRLKRSLVERGMSVGDIERVMAAGHVEDSES